MFYFFMGRCHLAKNGTLPCMCVCFQNYFEAYTVSGVHRQQTHPKLTSIVIVGRLNLQAPSIVLVAAGRVRHGCLRHVRTRRMNTKWSVPLNF